MKKHLGAWFGTAMLTLFAVVTLSAPAFAAWKLEDLSWRMLGRQSIGFSARNTGLGGVDTLYVSAAPARADTTTEFSLLDCDNMPLNVNGASAVDSVAAAYIVVCADSNVASSVNFKNTTVTVQVNYGDNAGGWQSFSSAYSPLATDGQKAIFVPLFQRLASITADLGIDYGLPGTIFAPRVRAIVTWGTSAAVPQAHIMVKKFVTSQTVMKQGSDL